MDALSAQDAVLGAYPALLAGLQGVVRPFRMAFAALRYKEKASDQLQILAILNRRLKEALRSMEEERERLAQARSKPTPRIGEARRSVCVAFRVPRRWRRSSTRP